MRSIRMRSPDGSAEIDAHPSKVESYENLGWSRIDPTTVVVVDENDEDEVE